MRWGYRKRPGGARPVHLVWPPRDPSRRQCKGAHSADPALWPTSHPTRPEQPRACIQCGRIRGAAGPRVCPSRTGEEGAASAPAVTSSKESVPVPISDRKKKKKNMNFVFTLYPRKTALETYGKLFRQEWWRAAGILAHCNPGPCRNASLQPGPREPSLPTMEKSTWLLWTVAFYLSGTTSLLKTGSKPKIIALKTLNIKDTQSLEVRGPLYPHLPHIHTAFCITLGALGKNCGLAERKHKLSFLFEERVKKRNHADWAGFCLHLCVSPH